jgi:hypothetical protein
MTAIRTIMRLKLIIAIFTLFFLIFVFVLCIKDIEIVDQASKVLSLTEPEHFAMVTNTNMSEVLDIQITPSKTTDIKSKVTEELAQISELADPVYQLKYSPEEALYHASLQFIAETPEEANLIAKKIDFLAGDSEDASNMCGPLSIAILKEAGLLPLEVDVHEAWLLCARENREDCFGMDTLKKVFFPPNKYEYIRVYESVKDYDFRSNPLQPGDWLYLFTFIHGYDHMLVVTKVDEKGNPYTVTNVNWMEGFIISEMKLYDTENLEEGLFYDLTKIERRKIGLMGTEGFLLVRKIGGLSE